MVDLLGVSWQTAGSVVISTVAMYLLFIVLIKALGQRSLLGTSSLDLACVAAFGSVIGRTTLLAQPTLLGGVIALTTLFAMQALLRALGGAGVVKRSLTRTPVVLMDGARVDDDALRRSGIGEDELRQALRRAGITRRADVGYVVLERNGGLSVLRADGEPDPWLTADLTPGRADGR
jgi:uncharacterized membrane protein YcaP (DUF421 family)